MSGSARASLFSPPLEGCLGVLEWASVPPIFLIMGVLFMA